MWEHHTTPEDRQVNSHEQHSKFFNFHSESQWFSLALFWSVTWAQIFSRTRSVVLIKVRLFLRLCKLFVLEKMCSRHYIKQHLGVLLQPSHHCAQDQCPINKFIGKLFIPSTIISYNYANIILSLPEIPVWKHQWIRQPTTSIWKTTVHWDKPVLKGFCLRMLSNLKTKIKLFFYFRFTCILKLSIAYTIFHSIWYQRPTSSVRTWKKMSIINFLILLFLQIWLLQLLRNRYREIS